MKIALITGDLSRKGAGVKEVVEGLSSALLDLGHEVEVFGLATDAWRAGDDLEWVGARAHACRVLGPSALGFAPDMESRLSAFDPDIVHLHGIWQYPSHVALQWHRTTRRPIVVSPHGMLHPQALAQSRPKKVVARRLYVDALLNTATALIGSIPEEVGHCRSYGVSGEVLEIPNGVNLPDLKADTVPQAPWHKTLSESDPVLLFLGRFHHTKNLTVLLDVWHSLHQSDHLCRWQLAVAGWGSNEAEADTIAQVNSAIAEGARIALTGPLFGQQKQAAFHHASGFVLPSLNEAFPISVLEAWGAALPTLLSAACNMNFAISKDAAFEIGTTPDTLATDLRRFIALGRAEHQAMGQRAFELVRREFSWPVVAKLHLTVYEQAATQPQRLSSIDGMTEN